MKRLAFSLVLLLLTVGIQAQTWTFSADAENLKGVCSGVNTTKRIVFILSGKPGSVIATLDAPIPSPFAVPVPNLAQDGTPVRDGLEKNFSVAVTNAAGAVTILTPSTLTRKVFKWVNDTLMTPYQEKNPYARGWISPEGDASNSRSFPGAITSLVLKNTYVVPKVQTYRGLVPEFTFEAANPCTDRYGIYSAVWFSFPVKSTTAGQRMFQLTPDLQRVGLEKIGFIGPDAPGANGAALANGKFVYNSDGYASFPAPMTSWSQGSGSYDEWGPISSDGLHIFNGSNKRLRVSNSAVATIGINNSGTWASDGKYLIVSTGNKSVINGTEMGVAPVIKCLDIPANTVKWAWQSVMGRAIMSDGVAVLLIEPLGLNPPLPACIVAIDPATGSHLWLRASGAETAAKETIRNSALLVPQAAGNGLLFAFQGSDLLAMDIRTGREVWRNVGSPYTALHGVAIISNTLIVSSPSQYGILDAATGRVLSTLNAARGAYTVFLANRMYTTERQTMTFRAYEDMSAKYQSGLPVALTLPAAQSGSRLSCFATGTDVRYQWFRDGTALPGATERWQPVGEAGSYTCTVSNAQGNVTTAPVTAALTYSLEPFTTLSGSRSFLPGDTLAFTVYAAGMDVTYQWTLGDTLLPESGSAIRLTTDATFTGKTLSCAAVDRAGNRVSLGSVILSGYASPVPVTLPSTWPLQYDATGKLYRITLAAAVTNPTGKEVYMWQTRATQTAAWAAVVPVAGKVSVYNNTLYTFSYVVGQQYRFLVTSPTGKAESNPCTVVQAVTGTKSSRP